MIIKNIDISQFRNYRKLKTDFSAELNWIYGPNGQGKTNLVEAIHYLCNLESFRTKKVVQLLRENKAEAVIESQLERRQVLHNVNIKITDIEGNLVGEAQSNINKRYNNFNLEIDGGTAFWNGKNLSNRDVSSGVYIIMLSDLDSYETKILKLMIIR